MLEYSLEQMNREIEEDVMAMIVRAEQEYTEQIMLVANHISDVSQHKPFILLSGPSGSGKTTTALRIEELLDAWQYNTHTVSLDNYFLPKEAPDLPLDEDGKPDYESPYRLDIPLLSQHLEMLAEAKPVEVPRFDFANQARIPGEVLHRKKGEMVLIEGIHTLNPAVVATALPHATGIFVNVETMMFDWGMTLPPERLRLMRRLVRDRLFRGCDLSNTLDRFDSVTRGEQKNIFPYRHVAEYSVNTFLTYELGVYSQVLYDSCVELPEDLQEFIQRASPVESALSPSNSIIREVTGASVFQY